MLLVNVVENKILYLIGYPNLVVIFCPVRKVAKTEKHEVTKNGFFAHNPRWGGAQIFFTSTIYRRSYDIQTVKVWSTWLVSRDSYVKKQISRKFVDSPTLTHHSSRTGGYLVMAMLFLNSEQHN